MGHVRRIDLRALAVGLYILCQEVQAIFASLIDEGRVYLW